MGSTAYEKIHAALSPFLEYQEFRAGRIDTVTYQKWIEREDVASKVPLNEDQINLSARCPSKKHEFARRALAQCQNLDILSSCEYDSGSIDEIVSRIDATYDHGTHLTYIFPEESALTAAIVRNFQPQHAACLGSFYGYWTVAAKAADPSLKLTLFDIDSSVMDLARRNFERLGLENGTDFIVGDAEQLVGQLAGIDLLMLDAEGPKSEDVPEDYRDKAIYYPLLRAAIDSLAPDALLVVHNVILSNFTGSRYFERKQRSYRQQYHKFMPLVQEHFVYTIVDSSEGVLVGRKRGNRTDRPRL